ncbi:MAG: tetratricopeptide repeat protein [bacterium]|nr:tetratricopeptide repeat protein [bacterium]
MSSGKKTEALKLIKSAAQPKSPITKIDPAEVTEANIAKFIRGEITLAQLQGITLDQAYAMAEIGYKLFLQGKYKDAIIIFDGLVALNPYDGYFHSVLGSIYARTNEEDKAIREFSVSANLSPHDPQVLVNLGELLLNKGQFEEALLSLKKAVALDSTGTNPAVARAKALITATVALVKELLEKKEAKK